MYNFNLFWIGFVAGVCLSNIACWIMCRLMGWKSPEEIERIVEVEREQAIANYEPEKK